MGVALLGTAASTATKTGVSYTLDSRAHKTFTAPLAQVKGSLLAALREMEFPIETDERTEEGERLVARVDGREVEIEIEPVTPKATKVKIVVRQGWFWKDRATAEEIIEQTSRDVDATILAARGAAGGFPAVFPKPGPALPEPRVNPASLDVLDPQRWRDTFQGAPPAGAAARARGPDPPPPPPVPAVSLSMVAIEDGHAVRAADPVRRPPGTPHGPAPARAGIRGDPAGGSPGEDNRWRVLRDGRLRQCPDPACPWGARLQRGTLVARRWVREHWWRVQVIGTDTVGWLPARDLAPQTWWDLPRWMKSASSQ